MSGGEVRDLQGRHSPRGALLAGAHTVRGGEDTWFLPLKAAVRRAEGVGLGEIVDVRLTVGR